MSEPDTVLSRCCSISVVNVIQFFSTRKIDYFIIFICLIFIFRFKIPLLGSLLFEFKQNKSKRSYNTVMLHSRRYRGKKKETYNIDPFDLQGFLVVYNPNTTIRQIVELPLMSQCTVNGCGQNYCSRRWVLYRKHNNII